MLEDVFSLFWWTLCSIIFHLFNQFFGPEHFSFSYFPLLKNDEIRSFPVLLLIFRNTKQKGKGIFFFSGPWFALPNYPKIEFSGDRSGSHSTFPCFTLFRRDNQAAICLPPSVCDRPTKHLQTRLFLCCHGFVGSCKNWSQAARGWR